MKIKTQHFNIYGMQQKYLVLRRFTAIETYLRNKKNLKKSNLSSKGIRKGKTRRYHLTPLRIAIIRKTTNIKC